MRIIGYALCAASGVIGVLLGIVGWEYLAIVGPFGIGAHFVGYAQSQKRSDRELHTRRL